MHQCSSLPRLPSDREIAEAAARSDDPEGLQSTVRLLRALAHPSRAMIYRQLAKAGVEGCTHAELLAALELRNNTLAGHLGTLIEAGLISGTHEGTTGRYRAGREALQVLNEFLLPRSRVA